MPHLTIEYSKNIESNIEINDLVQAMHNSAASIDALPIGGLRTRAVARKYFLVADGHSSNTFVNVVLRIAPGRSDSIKKEAGERLFLTLKKFFSEFSDSNPVALSFEIQELDANLRWKDSNIREHMKKRSE
ncbi:MAG: 5-carboxymethyl-2-hydroxymuconate isomerase [Woeseiaceae bacterium]|nr:5-carboxymethyl-2-hydroxymuconate isomerase [Woeseiaceae bacterium]